MIDPVLELTNTSLRSVDLRRRPRNASVTLDDPTTFTLRTSRNDSRSPCEFIDPRTAALLTRISSLPNWVSIRAAASSTDWSFVTSIWVVETLPWILGRACRVWTAVWPLDRSRDPRITWYLPESTRSLAVSNPIPWFAPNLLALGVQMECGG